MPEIRWNPWKMTAIGMALVLATAITTGLVVASWTGGGDRKSVATPEPAAKAAALQQAVAPAPRSVPATARSAPSAPAHPAQPTQAVVAACNQYAAAQADRGDRTMEVVKDAAVGAVLGAAVGAAGGAIADGGKGAGKGAAIGGVVGAGAGTLYGLNENRKNDQRYREAYAACMKSRGYPG